jgi:hypothetical protein
VNFVRDAPEWARHYAVFLKKLPYHIVIQHLNGESCSYFFAAVKEFDGCMSHGKNLQRSIPQYSGSTGSGARGGFA